MYINFLIRNIMPQVTIYKQLHRHEIIATIALAVYQSNSIRLSV